MRLHGAPLAPFCMSGSFIMSRLVSTAAETDIHDMSLPPDQMPPVKPKSAC